VLQYAAESLIVQLYCFSKCDYTQRTITRQLQRPHKHHDDDDEDDLALRYMTRHFYHLNLSLSMYQTQTQLQCHKCTLLAIEFRPFNKQLNSSDYN
jgi:hypothetical protein